MDYDIEQIVASGGEMDAACFHATAPRKGALVLFMDGFGARPALNGIAERLGAFSEVMTSLPTQSTKSEI